MSTKQNDIYLEEMQERFNEADKDQKLRILNELYENGFADEANKLEKQIEVTDDDSINMHPDYTSDNRPN